MKKVFLFPLITGIALSVSGISWTASEAEIQVSGNSELVEAVFPQHSLLWHLRHGGPSLLVAHVESAERDKVDKDNALKKLAELSQANAQLQKKIQALEETSEKERMLRAQEDQRQQALIAILTVKAQELGVAVGVSSAQAHGQNSGHNVCHESRRCRRSLPEGQQQDVSVVQEEQKQEPAVQAEPVSKSSSFLGDLWYNATHTVARESNK